ncbi:hypothetical protein [Alloyangia pacifica]|uniref:hypothetical protein n=1 Tax=Alloyangia pacifica TaxID=311180 RepID=UPI001CFF3AC6|nr:hypothetical protein [Alloyangia pacifica]
MRATHMVKMNHGNGVSIEIDLNQVEMNDQQRAIVAKLFAEISDKDIDCSGDCTEETCPAAEVLPKDEFEQIRGLRATIGTPNEISSMIICDFCLDCWSQPL